MTFYHNSECPEERRDCYYACKSFDTVVEKFKENLEKIDVEIHIEMNGMTPHYYICDKRSKLAKEFDVRDLFNGEHFNKFIK